MVLAMKIIPIVEISKDEYMVNFNKYKINPEESIFKYKNNYFKLNEENGLVCKNCDFQKIFIKEPYKCFCTACQTSNNEISNYNLKSIDYYKILFLGDNYEKEKNIDFNRKL